MERTSAALNSVTQVSEEMPIAHQLLTFFTRGVLGQRVGSLSPEKTSESKEYVEYEELAHLRPKPAARPQLH